MAKTTPALGYDNLQINSPYQLVQLTGLQISKQPNEHATARYTGIIPEAMADSYIERSTAADQIEIVQIADGSPVLTLFCGRVSQLAVKAAHGVYYLEVTAVSGTFDLDIRRRSRSFQDPNLSYLELFKQVLADYPDGDLIDNATQGAKTGGLIVQHHETDWEISKRAASQCGAVLIPDTTAAKPRFWVGLPESDPATLDNAHYSIIRNLAAYNDTTVNYDEGLTPAAFTGYLVESRQYLELGAAVQFQDQTLRVARSEAILQQGELIFTYQLFPENGIRQDLIINPRLSGASLEGKVIDRAKDTVKVHLTIDPKQDQATARWFPYASLYTAEGNSGWYCMPELGDQIRLFFPDCDETHAIVQSSVRQGGQSNQKMADPNVKYFGNTKGKELQMDGSAVTLTAKKGVTLIKLDQAQGVEVTSDDELLLTSQKDMKIDVTQKLNIKAQDGIYLFANGSSVIMDGTTDFKGEQVIVEATGPPLPVPEEVAATAEAQAEAKSDNTENILDAVQLGLDVLGLIPGVGAIADIANAGVSAARGDWLGAGLSLLGAIPIVGDAATAGKLTAKGAKLVSKVAKAAPKLTKAAKVAGKAGLAGYMGYSAASGVIEAGGEIAAGDYLKAARSLVNAFAAGKSLTRSRKIRGNVESFDGPKKKMNAKNGKKYTISRRKINRCSRKKTPSDHCLGDPVDAIIGEVIVDRQDFALPGRIPLAWNRHYGSQSKYRGLCGHGWETSGDIRLEFEPDGAVLFQDGSGAPYNFKSVPDEAPVVEPIDGRILWQDADYYTVRLKNGLTYYFPLPQKTAERIPLAHVSDVFGNKLEYLRDATGLREIRFSDGRRIEVTSQQGRITGMHLCLPGQPPRMLVRYSYDADSNLTTAYDALDNPYRFEYRGHLLTRHTNRNGLTFHYEYDRYTPEGRCIHTWGDGGLYDERFIYHDEQRITEAVNSFGVTSFLYDDRFLVLEETNPLGGITKYEYDKYGRATAVINPDGQRTEYAYDPEGNLLKLTRPDNKTIITEFNAAGQPLRVTDPNGAPWKQEWDEQGRLTKQISPLGSVSQYQYDRFGQPTRYTDTSGNLTQFAFDSYGNLTRLTNSAGQVTEFTYDNLGRLTGRVEPLGRRTSYQYDAKGRLIKATLPGGAAIACEYDAEDNLVTYKDENGAVTRLEYCGVNELKRRIQPDGQSVEYHYDSEERLIAITNQRGERYELKRDASGRIIEEVDYWGQNRQYNYSPAGYLQKSMDPLGRSISYQTDPLGRILAKVRSGPAGSGNMQSETFKYDANGNLIACANHAIEVKRFFDLEGKLVREDQGPDCSIAYNYDQNGNRISRSTTLKSGETTRTQTVNYGYDVLGRTATVEIAGYQPLKFTRNQLGQVTWETLGDKVKRFLEYDEAGYLSEQKVTGGAGPVFTREYSYDKAGNLVKKYDSVLGADKFYYDPMGRITRQIDPVGQVQRYLYDAAGDRLTTAINAAKPDDPDSQWDRSGVFEGRAYHFDRAGNLTKRSAQPETTEFAWDANGRLIKSVSNGQPTTYAYDPLGRRIAKQTGDTTVRFVWDGDVMTGELRLKAKGDGEPVCTRVREWVYYPGSFEPLAMVEADGLTETADATGINAANERIYYYCNLPNGCPERLLDENGKVVWAALYNAWGKVKTLPVDLVEQPIRLQGQYFDDETGLAYNRWRYYCPEIGAFVSQDPLGLIPGENVYAFGPNTQKWIDPLGLCKKTTPQKKKGSDFIVTENGTVLPTNKDYDLVDTQTPTNRGGDWFQIHQSHQHGNLDNPHTHFPQRNIGPNGRGSTIRLDRETTAADIDHADQLLRSGKMRQRINRKDLGGPLSP